MKELMTNLDSMTALREAASKFNSEQNINDLNILEQDEEVEMNVEFKPISTQVTEPEVINPEEVTILDLSKLLKKTIKSITYGASIQPDQLEQLKIRYLQNPPDKVEPDFMVNKPFGACSEPASYKL